MSLLHYFSVIISNSNEELISKPLPGARYFSPPLQDIVAFSWQRAILNIVVVCFSPFFFHLSLIELVHFLLVRNFIMMIILALKKQ